MVALEDAGEASLTGMAKPRPVDKGSLNLDLAPQVEAIDLHPDSCLSDPYEVSWRQLAAVLGAPAPWFHPALRDQDTISSWKPGDPPAIVPANHIELPTRALLDLAADEPDGSPAAAVCLWLARHLRRLDAEDAQQTIEEVRPGSSPASTNARITWTSCSEPTPTRPP